MSIKYFVDAKGEFVKKHYIKKFFKKYKSLWEVSLRSIIQELERFDEFKKTGHLDFIIKHEEIGVYKGSFRIAKTKHSRKNSGNRYIISLNTRENKIEILLVYHKNDIRGKNETMTWKKMIRENYKNYDFLR